jgi:hypothetical protein
MRSDPLDIGPDDVPPRPPWRRSEWEPVPRLSWRMPPRVAGDLRTALRLVVRSFATAVDLTLRRPGYELSFVALVCVEVNADEVAFTLICPHGAPLRLLSAINDAGSEEPWVQAFSRRAPELELELRFGLPEGVLVPLRVTTSAGDATISFSNHDLLARPSDHLVPQRCHSTSELLLFVGAAALSELPPYVDVGAALAQGLDEWLRWFAWSRRTGELLDDELLLVDRDDPERFVFDFDFE